MQVQHKTAFALSGAIWFAVGLSLMTVGITLLRAMPTTPIGELPLFSYLTTFFSESGYPLIILVVAGLALGYVKGKFVMTKAAGKGISHIRSLPNPTKLYHVYSRRFVILILGMMTLGMSIKWFGVPIDIRGFIDLAIGSALINGSMIYFREAYL